MNPESHSTSLNTTRAQSVPPRKLVLWLKGMNVKPSIGMEITGTSYLWVSCEKNGKYIDNLETKQRFPGAGQGAYNDHHKFSR